LRNFEGLSGLLGDQPGAEREGLPRTYRMRADAHYVDQLDTRRTARPIRLVPIDEIETSEPAPEGLDALVQSVAEHGLLQPLIARRHHGRYQLIAGRRRLAAAATAGLTEVPCLVYDADDAKAAALAEADNLRDTGGAQEPGPRFAQIDRLRDALRAMSAELDTLDSSVALLKFASPSSPHHRVAADLVQAQSWRARWLTRATSLLLGQWMAGRATPLNLVLDRVKTGFEAEAKVSGLQLEFTVASGASAVPVEADLGVLAISGGIFTTLSWLQGISEPHVEVHAKAPGPHTVKIEIVQRAAPVPAEAVRWLRESSSVRPDEVMAAMGLVAIDTLATRQGGTFGFSPIGARGSLIQLTATSN
jgi:hypothetical protein